MRKMPKYKIPTKLAFVVTAVVHHGRPHEALDLRDLRA
jgi:hypothetical protein